MEYFAGLDVGVNSTAICIIDDCGTVARSWDGSDLHWRGVGAIRPTTAAGRP
jgi:hypothetical protein